MEKDKSKKMKKKLKIKLLPFFIAIVLIALIYLLYCLILTLPIKNIYITGNNILKDHEIIEIAGIGEYPSFFKTSNNSIIKKLKSNSYVEKVTIKRKIYNQLYINIEENNPYFINTNNNLVLSNGDEVELRDEIYVPTLINYVPDTKYKELINKIKKIDENIWKQVSEIKYEPTEQDKDRFGLYMNDGNLVYLTLTKFNKLNYYKEIINEFKCQKGVLNLDSGNHFEIKYEKCD